MLFLMFSDRLGCKTRGERLKELEINGVVTKKDRPIVNHSSETIYLDNDIGQIILGRENIELFNKINIGDSIVKNKGSLDFYIYKNKIVTDTIQYIDFYKK